MVVVVVLDVALQKLNAAAGVGLGRGGFAVSPSPSSLLFFFFVCAGQRKSFQFGNKLKPQPQHLSSLSFVQLSVRPSVRLPVRLPVRLSRLAEPAADTENQLQ